MATPQLVMTRRPRLTEGRVCFDVPQKLCDETIATIGAPIAFRKGSVHSHPIGAFIRAAFYIWAYTTLSLNTFIVVVGDTPTRFQCMNVPLNLRDVRKNAAVHTMRPILSYADQYRFQNQLEERSANANWGTHCHCSFGPDMCEHVAAQFAQFAALCGGNASLCFLIYDVYAISMDDMETGLRNYQEMVLRTLGIPRSDRSLASILWGGRSFGWTGSSFDGENHYDMQTTGAIMESVRGNGAQSYHDVHPPHTLFSDTNAYGELVFKVVLQLGCRDEVSVFRLFLNDRVLTRQGPAPRIERAPIGYILPQSSTYPALLVTIELAQLVQNLVRLKPRTPQLYALLNLRLNAVINNKVEGVTPPPEHLAEAVITACLEHGMTPAPSEKAFLDALESDAVETTAHNQRIANVYAPVEPTYDVFMLTSALCIMLALVKYALRHVELGSYPNVLVFTFCVFTFLLLGAVATCLGLSLYCCLVMASHHLSVRYGVGHRLAPATFNRIRRRSSTNPLLWGLAFLMLLTTAAASVHPPLGDEPTVICRPVRGEYTCAMHHPGSSARPVPGAKIKVKIPPEPCQPARGVTPFGVVSLAHIPTVFATCQCNERAGLCERVLGMQSPAENSELWCHAIAEFHKHYTCALRQRDTSDTDFAPSTWTEWLSRPALTLPMKKRLAVARDALFEAGLGARDLIRGAFVKVELDVREVWKIPAPRIIQSMTDKLQTQIGPTFHSLSKLKSRLFHSKHPLLYAPSHSAEAIGAWFDYWSSQGFINYLEIDFRRFDGTLQPVAFRALAEEHYGKIPLRHDVMKALDAKIAKCGYTSKGLKYTIDGGRGSGDSDTTEGNTTLAASSILSYCCLTNRTLGVDFAMANAGDDVVILMRPEVTLPGLCKHLTLLGLSPEAQPVTQEISNVTFLSALFWPSADGTVLAPKMGRILARLGWTHDLIVDWDEHCAVIGLGLLDTCAHIPILRVLTRVYAMQGDGRACSPEEHHVRAERSHEACPNVAGFIYNRYGLTPDVVDEMEQELLNISELPYALQHYGFHVVIERDI